MTVQSRAMSLVEALINVAAGFLVALAAQLIVFPWFGLYPALGEHLTIGAIFAAVSVVRSYLLRRLFERLRSRQQRPV